MTLHTTTTSNTWRKASSHLFKPRPTMHQVRKYTKGLKTRGLEFSTSAIHHYGNNPSNIPIKWIGNVIKFNWCMDKSCETIHDALAVIRAASILPSHGAIIRILPQAQLLQCFAPHGFDMTINDLCRLWHRHDITAAMCRRLCTLVVMWWVTRSMFVENKHTYFH